MKIGGINFKGYATDPNWANGVTSIYGSLPEFKSGKEVDDYISSKAPDSPLAGKGEYLMAKATEGGYDPRAAIAVAQHESNFGTKGRAKRTLNPWNIGNDDSGRENYMDSPEGAIDAFHTYAMGGGVTTGVDSRRILRNPVDYLGRLGKELPPEEGQGEANYLNTRRAREMEGLDSLMQWAKSGAKSKTEPAAPVAPAPAKAAEPPKEPTPAEEEGSAIAHGGIDAWNENIVNPLVAKLFSPYVGKDIAGGIVESPKDISAGIYTGIRNTVVAASEFNNWSNNLMYKLGLPEGSLPSTPDLEAILPKAPEASSVTGGLIRGVAQFLPAFSGTMKVVQGALGIQKLSELSTVGRLGVEAVSTITSAMTSFEPEMQNLTDLAKGTPLEEPLSGLMKNPDSTRFQKRLYNAAEMVGIGAVAHGLIGAVRFIGGLGKLAPEAATLVESAREPVAAPTAKPDIVFDQWGPEATRFREELAASYPKTGPKATEQLAGVQALYEARANMWASEAEGRTPDEFFKGLTMKKGVAADLELPDVGVSKPKGYYYTTEEGERVIGLFRKADFSTLVHEGWHMFQDTLSDELATALGEWRGKPLKAWERSDHEHMARAFERWMTEGGASRLELPPPVLNIFAKFQRWMLDIYKSIRGASIDVQMSPEIESVFRRSLGSSGEMRYGSKPFQQSPKKGAAGWINPKGEFEPMSLGSHDYDMVDRLNLGDTEGASDLGLQKGYIRVNSHGAYEVDTITPESLQRIESNLRPERGIIYIDEATTGKSYMLHIDDVTELGGLDKALKQRASVEKYRPRYQEEETPTFGKWTSRMRTELERNLPRQASPEQYAETINQMQKAGRFREDEVQSSGVLNNLQALREIQGKDVVTREEVLAGIDRDMPQVDTVVLRTKPESEALKGGKNYAYESTIPGANRGKVVNLVFRNKPHGPGTDIGYSGTASAHWDMDEVLGHARAVEDVPLKSGKNTFVVEEIQSDLHQAGRKEGYKGEPFKGEMATKDDIKDFLAMEDADYPPGDEYYSKMKDQSWVFITENSEGKQEYFDTLKGAMENAEPTDRISAFLEDKNGTPTHGSAKINPSDSIDKIAENMHQFFLDTLEHFRSPQAPFKDWVPFTVKQTLAYAVDNGIDRIGFLGPDFHSKVSYATDASAQITYGQEMPRFLRSYAKQIGATIEKDALSIKGGRGVRGKDATGDYEVTVLDLTNSNIKEKGQPLFQEGEPPIPGMENLTGGDKPLFEEVDRGTAEVLLDDSNYPTSVVRNGKAYNFNLAAVTGEEKLRELFNKVAETFRAEMSDQARGVLGDSAVQELADSLSMTPEQIMLWERGKAANAEEIQAARTIMAYSARKLQKVGERAAGINASDMDIAEYAQLMGVHLSIQKAVTGMAAEAGRALRAWKIDLGPLSNSRDQAAVTAQIRSVLQAMGGREHLQDMARLLQEMETLTQANTFVRQAAKATTSDMLLEAWINGLLSNPLTHVANFVSNAVVVPLSLLEHSTAAGIGRVLGSGAGGISEMEVVSQTVGSWLGFKDGLRIAWRAFKTEENPFGAGRGKMEIKHRAITAENLGVEGDILGPAVDLLGEIVRLPGRALIASDVMSKSVSRRKEMWGLAWRKATQEGLSGAEAKTRMGYIVEHPEEFPEISTAAAESGDYYTFNKALGPTGQMLTGFVSSHPFLRLMIPFIRTPLNIAKFTGERTPLALLSKKVWAEMKSGDPARRDLAIAKMTLGSALMGLSAMMATSGSITGGGPKDAIDRANLRRTGWQPYSIKVGDTYYSYNRFEPLGSLLGLGADTADIMGMADAGDADKVAFAAVTAITKNVTSKTFLKGVIDFTELMSEPERFGGRYVQKFLAGMAVPSGVAQIERVTNPELSTAQSVVDEIKSRIPGLSDSLPPVRNLWGEPVKLGGGWGPDMLSPIYVSTDTHNPIDKEIVRNKIRINPLPKTLYGGEYGEEVSLSNMPNQNNLERGIRLTPQEYDRFQVIFGKEVKKDGMNVQDFLNKTVKSAEYLGKSDGPEGGKSIEIKSYITAFKKAALAQLLQEFPELQALTNKRQQDKAHRALGY